MALASPLAKQGETARALNPVFELDDDDSDDGSAPAAGASAAEVAPKGQGGGGPAAAPKKKRLLPAHDLADLLGRESDEPDRDSDDSYHESDDDVEEVVARPTKKARTAAASKQQGKGGKGKARAAAAAAKPGRYLWKNEDGVDGGDIGSWEYRIVELLVEEKLLDVLKAERKAAFTNLGKLYHQSWCGPAFVVPGGDTMKDKVFEVFVSALAEARRGGTGQHDRVSWSPAVELCVQNKDKWDDFVTPPGSKKAAKKAQKKADGERIQDQSMRAFQNSRRGSASADDAAASASAGAGASAEYQYVTQGSRFRDASKDISENSGSYDLEYALACFYGDGEYFLSKKGCGYVNPPPTTDHAMYEVMEYNRRHIVLHVTELREDGKELKPDDGPLECLLVGDKFVHPETGDTMEYRVKVRVGGEPRKRRAAGSSTGGGRRGGIDMSGYTESRERMAAAADTTENRKLDIGEKKLELEEKRLELDAKKLELDEKKQLASEKKDADAAALQQLLIRSLLEKQQQK